jgi:hypothetical protein
VKVSIALSFAICCDASRMITAQPACAGEGNCTDRLLLLGLIALSCVAIGSWIVNGLQLTGKRTFFGQSSPDILQHLTGRLGAGIWEGLFHSLDYIAHDLPVLSG